MRITVFIFALFSLYSPLLFSSDYVNSKLDRLKLDSKACSSGNKVKCAEYIISKINKDKKLYSTIDYSSFEKQAKMKYPSPEKYLKDADTEMGDALVMQKEYAKQIDNFVENSAIELNETSMSENYMIHIKGSFSNVFNANSLNLQTVAIVAKSKAAMLNASLNDTFFDMDER